MNKLTLAWGLAAYVLGLALAVAAPSHNGQWFLGLIIIAGGALTASLALRSRDEVSNEHERVRAPLGYCRAPWPSYPPMTPRTACVLPMGHDGAHRAVIQGEAAIYDRVIEWEVDR